MIKRSMLGLAIMALVVGAMVAPKVSYAATTLQHGNSLGDAFILSKLFGADSMIGGMSSAGSIGNLFILDKLFAKPVVTTVASPSTTVVTPTVVTVAQRMAGKIVIQTQDKGQAWYVSPVTLKRSFLGPTPADAMQVMADQALGVSNSTFESYGGVAPANLSGRFLIKPDDSGKLYYVKTSDRSIVSISSPSDALQLIQEVGVGITNADLAKITVAP